MASALMMKEKFQQLSGYAILPLRTFGHLVNKTDSMTAMIYI
jgi:hypothetical protein